MTEEEIRQRSKEKVNQVHNLMNVLHIRVEARQRMSPDGYIDNTILFIDDEKYDVTDKKEEEITINKPEINV